MTGYQFSSVEPPRVQQNVWDWQTKRGFEKCTRQDRGIDQSIPDDEGHNACWQTLPHSGSASDAAVASCGKWRLRTQGGQQLQTRGSLPQVDKFDLSPEVECQPEPGQRGQPVYYAGHSRGYGRFSDPESDDHRDNAEKRRNQECGQIPQQAGSVRKRSDQPAPQHQVWRQDHGAHTNQYVGRAGRECFRHGDGACRLDAGTSLRLLRQLASEFLRDPLQVQIGNRDELKGNQDIVQVVRPCQGTRGKNKILMEVLSEAGVSDNRNCAAKGIVFCSTKAMCGQLAKELHANSVPCAAIHGDKEQWERERALDNLRTSRVKLLVATNVAARGIDIKGITLVVNYDAPNNTEDYVHRIGRTGRAGQKGYAVSLITDRDAEVLGGIIDVMRRTDQNVPPEVERMAVRRRGGQRFGNQRFGNRYGHDSSNRFGSNNHFGSSREPFAQR